ncbi:MAG: 2-C-methyl-D-erythritol 4-phosphate cytidylyltransferase [Chryseolinea sp.]
MHPTEHALIVAGGKGTRIPGKTSKQFLELNGLPVLMHTINAFNRYSSSLSIVLVLPEEDFTLWRSLCKQHNFNRPITLQAGGITRFQSVKRGLNAIAEDGLVAIHDGVRPLVTQEMITASFKVAKQFGSAVASVSLKESIREVSPAGTSALDRSRYKLIQTPQTFRVELIKRAYEFPEDQSLTDDASIAERAGHNIFLFDGDYQNIKITTPEDLVLAEALLNAGYKA